uniref:Leucine rich repeat containing 69 n=1 Tax=Amphiprion percula TaxID=161767 RepID=A0A3P8T4N4_AMPPE
MSVVRALCGGGTSLNLSSQRIKDVPKCVSRLTKLSVLLLNNNSISRLPAELLSLRQLAELNLGNNDLEEVPAVLGHLDALKKLYLFSNQITVVPPEVIGGFWLFCMINAKLEVFSAVEADIRVSGGLENLVVLNLNHNHIQRLPPEIKSLTKLQHLSVLDNKLEEVPVEIGHLASLSEINLTSNKLSQLPQQLYQCKELTKLYAARNKLTSLPEVGIHFFLTVVRNWVGRFASYFGKTELVARFVLQEDRKRFSLIHRMLPHYPSLAALLACGSCCAVCLGPFLTTWLECVHFIRLKKDMKMKTLLTVPVRALLCSYKCFNREGHSYYGVATR